MFFEKRVNLIELSKLIRDYFDNKVQDVVINDVLKTVDCTLYKTFRFRFGFDERYKTMFGASVSIGDIFTSADSFTFEKLSLNGDDVAIKNTLVSIDEACRLRLPDKFLEAFDNSYTK